MIFIPHKSASIPYFGTRRIIMDIRMALASIFIKRTLPGWPSPCMMLESRLFVYKNGHSQLSLQMNMPAYIEANILLPMKLPNNDKIIVKPKPRSSPYRIAFFNAEDKLDVLLFALSCDIFGKSSTDKEFVITPGKSITGRAIPHSMPYIERALLSDKPYAQSLCGIRMFS